ncbi:Vitellogenin-2 protein [Melia azedarach]|uniref:Vitellogenin-2 protein n=1 Tax=Melia azedarach TaxID=155640 RepID=A0ACC1Z032_MELAZ|nr:Vitellogenin-2 protein [Melia azedarach]
MADFGYFSDTDDSAVEDLITQTKDLSVLEQVAAINCSGFTDSVLPTELERRFSKLKSFPATKPKTSINNDHTDGVKSLHHSKSEVFSDSKQNPDGKEGSERKSVSGYDSSPLNSSDSSVQNEIFSESKKKADGKMNLKENSKRGSVSVSVPSPSDHSKSKPKSKSFFSPLSSPSSWMDSPSPPQKKGCFWCSPKSSSKKKSRENPVFGNDLDWGKNDELLSDLSIFSVKEQEKILKKAMKEEEKERYRTATMYKRFSLQDLVHFILHQISNYMLNRSSNNVKTAWQLIFQTSKVMELVKMEQLTGKGSM